MKEIILKYTALLILLLGTSCDAQDSVYSIDDINKLKIAYNQLTELEYKGKSIIISDSISSGNLEVFYRELYEKQNDKLNRDEFYSKIREQNKKFKVRDSFELKKALNNYNMKGDFVLFFSKIVEDILTINVYELDHSIPNKRKVELYNYPYSKLFFKSPKKVYFFKFDNQGGFETMEETVFWQ